MSFVLDGVLIAICIAVVVRSVRRGFVKTILSIAASIAAVLLAVVFTPNLSGFFYDKFVLSGISSGIAGTIASLAGNGDAAGIADMFSKMPDALSGILRQYNVSEETVSAMLKSAEEGTGTVQSVADTIAAPIASAISSALAFIAIFIVALIVLKIVIVIIDAIFKFPVLNTVNKVGGLALGIVLAVVVIFIYSAVAANLVGALGSVSPKLFGADVINGTIIVKFFSENNIFGIISDTVNRVIS